MKHRRSGMSWLTAMATVLLAVCLPLCAQAAKLVRVGYVDYSGFVYTALDGHQSGYVCDLMMECAQTTDREYAFVQLKPEEALEMCRTGQVDLLVGVPEAMAQELGLTLGQEEVLTVPMALVVQPDSDLCYDEYNSLKNKTIAVCTQEAATQLDTLLQENGISAQVQSYPDRVRMLEALMAGEADAAVIETDMGISGLRVMGLFGERVLYCAVPQGGDPALLQETDNALKALVQHDPDALQGLHQRYLVVDDDAYPSLTKDERNYIRKGREMRVAVPEGTAAGTAADTVMPVLEELSRKTGLIFVCETYPTEADALVALRGGKAEMMLGFDSDYYWAQLNQVRHTVPYLKEGYRVVRPLGVKAVQKLAVVENSYAFYRLERDGSWQMLPCADERACVQAVLNGLADGAMLRSGVAESVLYELGSQGLVYETWAEYDVPLCIAVSRLASVRLVPILNKAIDSIRPQRFRTIATTVVGEVSIQRMEASARKQTLAVAITAFVVLALLGAASLYVGHRLNGAMLQVKARNDYLRGLTSQIRRPAQTLQGVAVSGSRLNRADTAKALGHAGDQLSELAAQVEVMSQLDDRTFTISPMPVRLSHVLERLAEYIRQRADNRGVEVTVRMPEGLDHIVMMDEESYRRVCHILIENALSRTKNGSEMEILFDLERVREKKSSWTLVTAIGDNGTELSPKFIRRISERPRKDSERVLGLHLMTAKKIVQVMGGEMDVRRRPTGGMRMAVRIPLDEAELLQMMSMNRGVYSDSGLLSGINVLVAEENPITGQLLYSVLSNEGAHVDLVTNGQQLMEQFLASAPAFYQLIMTDLFLPGMSGGEAALTIRDLPRRDSSSVYIIGMRSGTETAAPEEERAMNMILQKPLDLAVLCRRLRTWLFSGG